MDGHRVANYGEHIVWRNVKRDVSLAWRRRYAK